MFSSLRGGSLLQKTALGPGVQGRVMLPAAVVPAFLQAQNTLVGGFPPPVKVRWVRVRKLTSVDVWYQVR